MIDVVTTHLFGRHVPYCSHHRSGSGLSSACFDFRLCDISIRSFDQLCQTEVENLDAWILSDEEVLGFQIPVNNGLLVRDLKTTGYLDGVIYATRCGNGPSCKHSR